ncbi:MAG: magnesium transporter [bacterium]|nr:magnesium transporter [bacterium]
MTKKSKADQLNQPASTVARKDAATLREDATVQQALEEIRSHGLGEKIVYFYVVDTEGCLTGVLPTRRLLMSPLKQCISEVMIKRVKTIPADATVLEAYDLLAHYKYLALPVVDEQKHIVGVIDVTMFADEDFEISERERMDKVFESIGFRVSQIRNASPFRAFRFRFPWLMATIGSGTICALLASAYDVTLAKSLVLAFFLTLVLGLGESVSMQSMTVAIHTLRLSRPTLRWYVRALRREVGTAFLLGGACSIIVGLTVWGWRGEGLAAIVIGSSLLFVIFASCLFGLSIPALLHALKLDPKISAGPVTLAVADICTIILYLSLAALLL